VAVEEHVRRLQEDLRELGFLVATETRPNDVAVFDMHTEWAVKEFQIYASMDHVAKMHFNGNGTAVADNRLRAICAAVNPPVNYPGEHPKDIAALGRVPASVTLPNDCTTEHPVSYYVASLEQVVNQGGYDGPISGVVNARTRAAIQYWKEHRYRCPVVIEAWSMKGKGESATQVDIWRAAKNSPPIGVNIWKHDEIADVHARMYFRDFTQYYNYPTTKQPTQPNIGEYYVLGFYQPWNDFGGPNCVPKGTTWEEAEMLPDKLIPSAHTVSYLSAASNINSAETSTYKIVRSVAEKECYGYFDSVNCYDDCIVSIGPCHWAMSGYPNNIEYTVRGELAPFLSYLLATNQDAFMQAYGNFGILPACTWGTNGGDQYLNDQKKFNSWIRCHTENAVSPLHAVSLVPTTIKAKIASIPYASQKIDEAHYYKSWHWYFRWSMAGRTIPAVQQAMWNMTRMRIRDYLDVQVAIQTTNAQGTVVNFTMRLGDIITSEKGVAILHRWHVFRPGHVTGLSASTPHVRNTIKAAIHASSLNWNQAWNNDHETVLVTSLLDKANSVFNSDPKKPNRTFNEVADWPNGDRDNWALKTELGNHRTDRNTFVLDTTGI
jgi:peptidoglycan hydrolase-like protein with peptidoglycan-binding domain